MRGVNGEKSKTCEYMEVRVGDEKSKRCQYMEVRGVRGEKSKRLEK